MVDTVERQRTPGSRARDTSGDSVIVALAEQLLAESDKLARNIKEDAEREAEAKAASIVGEAERGAQEVVSASTNKAASIVGEAERRAQEVVSTSTKKAEGIVGEAERRAQEVVSTSTEKAEGIVGEAERRAQDVLSTAADEAESKAGGIVAEAERRAQEVVSTAADKAESKAGSIVGEAERRAQEVVSTAANKAERTQSEARVRVHTLVQRVKAEVQSSVGALDSLLAPDGGRGEDSISPPGSDPAAAPAPLQGVGRTVPDDAPQGPRTPRLQGYDIRSGAPRRPVANGR